MSVYAELHDGTRLEFPDGTNPEVIQTTVKRFLSERKPSDVSVSGVAAEAGKGLLRGASDVAMMAPKAIGQIAGPVIGPMAQSVLEAAAAPSRSLVQASPENRVEQFAGTAGELAGASVVGGGLSRPVMNVALPAVLGATGEQIAGEPGKIVGSLSTLAIDAGKGLLRLLARGSQPAAAGRLATLEQAGVSPTLADIAPSRANVQAISGKVPLARGITNKAITNQADEIKQQVDDLLPTVTTKERAGEAVQAGLGAWKKEFYATWRKLDDKVSGLMGQTPVKLDATKEALFKLTTKIDNDELNAIFTPATLNKIQDAVSKGESLPFDVVLQLRREIGQRASSGFAALQSDVAVGDLKALYGALSKDITKSAEAIPGAAEAIKRANKYYSAGSDRIDAFYGRLYKQANPEKVFDAIESGTRRGALEVRTVMKAIPQDARDEVISLTLSRMGQAKPSAQGAAVEFSPDTFLTNWNRMNTDARRALFAGSSNPEMASNLDKITKAIGITKESGKALYNPSGTGAVVGYGTPLAGLFYAPLTTMTALGSATSASYLMTNPKFVKWLAQGTQIPQSSMQAHVARLAQIANSDAEMKDAVTAYANALGGNGGQ